MYATLFLHAHQIKSDTDSAWRESSCIQSSSYTVSVLVHRESIIAHARIRHSCESGNPRSGSPLGNPPGPINENTAASLRIGISCSDHKVRLCRDAHVCALISPTEEDLNSIRHYRLPRALMALTRASAPGRAPRYGERLHYLFVDLRLMRGRQHRVDSFEDLSY